MATCGTQYTSCQIRVTIPQNRIQNLRGLHIPGYLPVLSIARAVGQLDASWHEVTHDCDKLSLELKLICVSLAGFSFWGEFQPSQPGCLNVGHL